MRDLTNYRLCSHCVWRDLTKQTCLLTWLHLKMGADWPHSVPSYLWMDHTMCKVCVDLTVFGKWYTDLTQFKVCGDLTLFGKRCADLTMVKVCVDITAYRYTVFLFYVNFSCDMSEKKVISRDIAFGFQIFVILEHFTMGSSQTGMRNCTPISICIC